MRHLAAAALLALAPLPALAWKFSPTPICTLSHATETTDLAVTYDAAAPEPYAIALTRKDGTWPRGALFAMQFEGPRPNRILTDRHSFSDGGSTLTVTDRGFGNVLNGLQFNDFATAQIANEIVTLRLEEAGPAVEAFRNCTEGGLA